jgi:hypothetical protein
MAGNNSAISTTMMPITTNSSTKVKPEGVCRWRRRLPADKAVQCDAVWPAVSGVGVKILANRACPARMHCDTVVGNHLLNVVNLLGVEVMFEVLLRISSRNLHFTYDDRERRCRPSASSLLAEKQPFKQNVYEKSDEQQFQIYRNSGTVATVLR